ncbi:YphA family membrane protein [Effusibacillus pohliae]|uniref:YphA family membrane protein n=1 Tax=Effusibacillus pohliae TaxID=232270 RepID=UPI000363461F|nr:hypothetical protein [Effusibacillus pohliae]
MNPDVSNLLTMLVLAILFATDWGTRYVRGSRLQVAHWVVLFVCIGIFGFFEVRIHRVPIHLGSVLVLLAVFAYAATIGKMGRKLHFLCAAVTAAACCFVLMTLFPYDPAFYLLDERYLHPAVAVASAYLFSREPLFSLNASAAGILLAGIAHDSRLAAVTGVIRVGGSDLLDLVCTTVILSFLVDLLVVLAEFLLAKMNRRSAGRLEGDAT